MAEHSFRPLLAVLLPFALLAIQCQPVTSTEVGSPSDTQIQSMDFSIDTTYVSYYSSLTASGKVFNHGTSPVTPPWYVECQFYSDSMYTLKLGGNNMQITIPLSVGQGTLWTISFSPPTGAAQQYPKFKISNLRAIYKK